MNKDWILQTKETRRAFSNATWVPLRASMNDEKGDVKNIGYIGDYFGCGSAAFPPEHRELVEERLGWSDIGIGHTVAPYAYEDGYYASIDQFQYNDKEPIGVNLVFEHPQPVVGGKQWILNPDLVVALRLIKEGTNWVRPEENFVVVARESFNERGEHQLIEIKREFLLDYLAARNLSLRVSYYRQRVENVPLLEGSEYAELAEVQEERDGGRFELRISGINDYKGFPICQAKPSPGDSPKAIHLESSSQSNTNTGISRAEIHQGVRTATLQAVFKAASMCCGP